MSGGQDSGGIMMYNKDLLPEKAEENFIYWTNADGINKEEMDDKGCGEGE